MNYLRLQRCGSSNGPWMVMGINDDTVTKIEIPEFVDGHPVEIILENAFKNNTTITEVNLPRTITQIKRSAFEGCVNLRAVYRQSSLNYLDIEDSAFADCVNLKSFAMNRIYSVGCYAFSNCYQLDKFPFAECKMVKVFNKGAFKNTPISVVCLFDEQRIEDDAFAHTHLRKVFLNNKLDCSEDFYEAVKNAVIYVPKHSPLMDLGYLGIQVEEKT